MFGLDVYSTDPVAASFAVPAPRPPRVALCYHRQCAWCLRLKHRDGTPHGHPWPRLPFYSSGICAPCKAKVQRHVDRDDSLMLASDLLAHASTAGAA